MATVASINFHGKFEHNPRGKLWLKEKNKFCEKQMKKMGWSEGKGLGKHENGITENIKVRMQNNKLGLGWQKASKEKSRNSIESLDYDVVLNGLRQKYESTKEQSKVASFFDGSLEDRSQQFKNRLHYRKFLLGKDISQYSEKDMRSIFFSKPKEETKRSNEENDAEQEANGFQFSTKNVLNMVDYFNEKMKHKKTESERNGTALLDSTTDKCVASHISDDAQEAECFSENYAKAKTSKKRKISQCGIVTDGNEVVTQCSLFTANDNEFGVSETTCETEEPRKKEKRKKRKILDATVNDSNELESLKLCSPDSSPTKKCKRKKRPKAELVEDNKISDSLSSLNIEQTLHNSDAVLQSKKQKKNVELCTKAKKLKTNVILKFKSCLKENFFKKSLRKQVSFSEDISFRTFDSELPFDSMDDEQVSSINVPELVDVNNENIDDEMNTEMDEEKGESALNGSAPVQEILNTESKTNLEHFAFDTVSPVKQSSVYNSWSDSHRQASKMTVYKNMIKSIKKHDILGNTNLTEIKGYGNWGLE